MGGGIKSRFVSDPFGRFMWDRKVKGQGTMKFANQVLKRRAKKKMAKVSRRRNRGNN